MTAARPATAPRPIIRRFLFRRRPQKQIVERSEAALLAGPLRGKHITTFVRPATQFWPAEEYHQHFADRNPVRYAAYRVGCGRDTILKALWGGR